AAMRIVNMTWTQIRQGETHKRVFDIADEMLSRVNKLLNSFSAIGDSIKKAQDNYDSARKLITEGGQSIVTSANKLINLGAKVKKDSRNKLSVYLTDVAEVAPLELPQDSETPTDEPDNNE
ncbi:MAG: DNA recombination protein RmuC, partial [Bacteroidales bacterium]|nr:DNA recombination protein RmuC [Bacteroidales bacterium]